MNVGNDEEFIFKDNLKNVEKCLIIVFNKGLLYDCYILFYGYVDYIQFYNVGFFNVDMVIVWCLVILQVLV